MFQFYQIACLGFFRQSSHTLKRNMHPASKRNNTMGIEICFISVFEVAALTIT